MDINTILLGVISFSSLITAGATIKIASNTTTSDDGEGGSTGGSGTGSGTGPSGKKKSGSGN